LKHFQTTVEYTNNPNLHTINKQLAVYNTSRNAENLYFLESLDLPFCCVGWVRGRFMAGPGTSCAALVAFACTHQSYWRWQPAV